jgi:hypothetical protein
MHIVLVVVYFEFNQALLCCLVKINTEQKKRDDIFIIAFFYLVYSISQSK